MLASSPASIVNQIISASGKQILFDSIPIHPALGLGYGLGGQRKRVAHKPTATQTANEVPQDCYDYRTG
jgi:hypothetical protein